MSEINSYLLRERIPAITLGASGVVGTAAATVDIVSNVGVTASAANLTFTLANPTDTRSGRSVLVMNTGANAFTMYANSVKPGQYIELIWGAEDSSWHSPSVPTESAADFWRSGSLAGIAPDGTADVQDAIFRSGQVAIDTGVNGDSGMTLDDLRSRNSTQLTAGDGGVTDTNMTAIGVDLLGKVRLSNSLSVPDLRATNPAPQDFAAGDTYAFKTASAIGILPAQFPGVQTYVMLETQRRYSSAADLSGGPVIQRVTLDDGRKIYRDSTNATTWSAWKYETQVQTEFNLQDLLQMNGQARVSLTGEVNWTGRLITMTAGVTPQELSGYHDIYMPAVGATIPVQGGGTRTVVAATVGQVAATGGVQLNVWDTLWYRALRATGNTTVATNFLITPYTSIATTGVPGILNGVSYPGTHPGEWIRVVSREDSSFKWGTGDTVGLGGQFGGGHDLTIAYWTAMKNRAQGEGYFYTTFATATPQRVGLTGSIRWIDGGAKQYINSNGYTDVNQAGRAAGTVVIGVNGAANRAWETVTAADAITKFGGAQRGNFPITAVSTVVQLNDNETLYYAASDTGAVNGGSWYVAGYAGPVVIPVNWLPIMSYQVTGANATTQVLVGGVQRSLRAGDAIFMGKADGDLDRLHRRMGVTHTGLKYTRWSHGGIFTGAGANGAVSGPDGLMVSWDANQMIYGISDMYASWGAQYLYINPPAIGTAIPYATTNGAVAITRVVQNISGRAYIPMSVWDSLWFIPPAYSGGTGSVDGDFVMTNYGLGNITVPVGAVRIAHYNGSRGQVTSGEGKVRVAWADGTVTQPGIALASATPALRVQNDHAQGTGDWRLVTVAGQTAPGMTAALPVVTGVVGGYAAPFTAFYRYNTVENDTRGQIEIEGLISLNGNIVGTRTVAFLNGVAVRGQPIYMGMMHRSTSGDAQPIPVQMRFINQAINGQTGVAIQVYGESGNTLNDYATLGPNGGAQAAGIPQWLSLGPLILPHA
jgi:hypothetical protein